MNPQYPHPKKKNINIYIGLIIGPFIALVVSAMLQIITRFVVGGSNYDGGIIVAIVNVLGLLVGTVSVLAIVLLPLWIILLVLAVNHNNSLKAPTTANPSVANQQPPQRP